MVRPPKFVGWTAAANPDLRSAWLLHSPAADLAARIERRLPGSVSGPPPMALVIRLYDLSLEPRSGRGRFSRPVPHL
jgi:hypothetical protein